MLRKKGNNLSTHQRAKSKTTTPITKKIKSGRTKALSQSSRTITSKLTTTNNPVSISSKPKISDHTITSTAIRSISHLNDLAQFNASSSSSSAAAPPPSSSLHHQQIANISYLNSSPTRHKTRGIVRNGGLSPALHSAPFPHRANTFPFISTTVPFSTTAHTSQGESDQQPLEQLKSTHTEQPHDQPKQPHKPKQQQQQQQKNKKNQGPNDASLALGVQAKKDEDFSKWYQQLVVRSELIEYYDISGCYILRPWAYEIWENITKFLDTEFKKLGVKNASFPLLVPRRNLEKEEAHIEGFAAEVAWVTHSGSTKLEEPVAIRPTSETIMYPAFKKWIHSHRDLPLRLNQWCNVLRWEFKDPTPFIRAREFLWQEGHTAYAKQEDADAEVYKILDLYERAYEEILACSVVKGHKTAHEKFAGGAFTTTVEGYIPGAGRGIQAATSHSLGQNFAKMFDVSFQDEDGQVKHVWQNSWGFTFRSMGVMIMTHSDDKGLVLPPKIAPIQAILIPIIKGDNADSVNAAVEELNKQLLEKGIRSEVDARTNVSPGFKYNHWELRGVPVRIEVGARDLEKRSAVLARRDLGTKSFAQLDDRFADSVQGLLDTIQSDLRIKSKTAHQNAIHTATTWDDFMKIINKDQLGLVPWCEKTKCEQEIKVRSAEAAKDVGADRSSGAKSLCIPFEQPAGDVTKEKCLNCDDSAQKWVLFGRSY